MTAPTRDAVLASYRPIRASIQAVLKAAVPHCRKPDLDRAARHLDLVDDSQLEDETTFNMLCDVALFEPNQRRRRVIDRFLETGLADLDPADRETAGRFRSALFSIFRVAGRHGSGGVRIEDLLAPGPPLWLMDESLEASAQDGLVIAMRLFDAGPFHAGFGIVVQPDAEAVALCTAAAARGGRPPFRHSLAAALYGDAIAEATFDEALDILPDLLAAARDALAPPPPRGRRPKPRALKGRAGRGA